MRREERRAVARGVSAFLILLALICLLLGDAFVGCDFAIVGYALLLWSCQ